MKKNIMGKNLRKSIVRSLGRYIAIVLIIALGAGLFVGLLSTKKDLVASAQSYTDQQNMFDLRLLSSYGWSEAQVSAVKNLPGVASAEGMVTVDVIAGFSHSTEDTVFQLHTIPTDINRVLLRNGRMPQSPNECLADSYTTADNIIGKKLIISDTNASDTLDMITVRELTVVGQVSSPLFMDMTRGNTSLGNGSINSFVYVMPEVFDMDYYTEIAVTIPGSFTVYTDAYADAMEAAADTLEPMLEPLAQDRFTQVKLDAEEAYQEGFDEYSDALLEFEEGKAQAIQELADGRQELENAQAELDYNEWLLADAQAQLADGQAQLASGRVELAKAKADAMAQIADAQALLLPNYNTVKSNLAAVGSGLSQVESGLEQLQSGKLQLELAITAMDVSVSILETSLSVAKTALSTLKTTLETAKENMDPETVAQLEAQIVQSEETIKDYEAQLADLSKQKMTYDQQMAELEKTETELLAKQQELLNAQTQLNSALAELEAGIAQLDAQQVQAQSQFAAAEAELEAGQLELDTKAAELEAGMLTLEEGKQALMQGWQTYYEGAEKVRVELADAAGQLADAKKELEDARQTLDTMAAAETFILDRNTNIGYVAVNNNSDIVSGVSRVFPVFFLLVAALVCITTMTRMVEEERTQIGTLKALGYSNLKIASKYLIYAGSAAVIGCGLGVFVGSIVFPLILWQAYGIILTMGDRLKIVFDIPLCLSVVSVYTIVMLLVTWNCCRLALREVPAELIRPKPPTSGKKILLEYIPFWDKFSFLNKVTLRNIFRYRQRLFMMLIGIGGCTALLVTGFGIGDSIVDIVSYQFESVTPYDMQVQFSEGLDEEDREDFKTEFAGSVSNIGFAHQSSVEMDHDGVTKNVFLIAPKDPMDDFYDFHYGDKTVDYPKDGEAILSVGIAEAMDIQTGESITLRNSDLQMMTVTVSGIFDNNVYNYVITTPATVADHWGQEPEYQIAYVNVPDGVDPHPVGAEISSRDDVLMLSVSEDLASQVGSMLGAMNMIVVTVVICAGLLAVIVLYNLTNINITERLREIATIKVLGFYEGESAAYVFKENLILSVMGAAVGLLGGKYLLDFVMSQIRLDMVWLPPRIQPISLLWSVVITLLMAVLVDFVLYFRLEKINMAEALKSVE